MVDPDRRPTAQEIEELIDLVRRDPASPAFIDLGEAYLALGRPRDAIQVGNLGLEAAPDNLEGRVMLARAFAALHQWKEAQGELLRVVKVDRSNRQGFALLGEVLLRRTDFERAVPVLQHAQNLDPTSPQILAMLRRARAGQPLDAPVPIPQPIPPRGETGQPSDIQHSARAGKPTAHSKPRVPAAAPAAATMMPQPPPKPPPMPISAAVAPTMALPPSPSWDQPAPAPSFADAAPRVQKQTAPPPMSVEGIKPRIVQSAKPTNAAQASLRQSAAVGENYLNDLLTGGLLDVAGVRVPEVDYDLRPDRRWGRSTRRAFIFLFVVLVLGVGGGGTWFYLSEKGKSDAVAEKVRAARVAFGTGDYKGVVESLKILQDALAIDPGHKLTFAYYVEFAGIAALLYGEAFVPNPKDATKEIALGAEDADRFYKHISSGDDQVTAEEEGGGYRAMLIGKAAVELSRLPVGTAKTAELEAAVKKLDEVNKTLDSLLATDKDDKWARYLKARALLAAGDPKTAAAMFKEAADGPNGVAAAMIDQANLFVDEGNLDDAFKWFKQANDKSKDHPLAIIGESLAKGEASINPGDVIGELNAKFIIDKLPSRVAAWRWLALAAASITSDDYKAAADALVKAQAYRPPSDPRFWARVAWIHYKLARPAKEKDAATGPAKGDLAAAVDARKNCIWFSGKAATDPTVQLVDAGLALAGGTPDRVLEMAAKLSGVRPDLLRAYALVDQGKLKDAMELTQKIVKLAPDPTGKPCESDNKRANLEARTICELARMVSSTGNDRLKASESLTDLASASKNQIPRHALGYAFLLLKDAPDVDVAIGKNLDNAKKHLKRAYEDIAEDAPNPLVYRTLTALGEVALIEKDIDTAQKMLEKALAANSGYLPARTLNARILLRTNNPDEALKLIEPIIKEANTPGMLVTYAEALVARKSANAKDKDEAKKLLAGLKDKPGISNEDLTRIALMIDPKLPEDLGLPPLEEDDPKKKKKKGP